MALLKTYAIAEINDVKLQDEIAGSGFVTNYTGFNYDGASLEVLGDALLDEPSLDALILAHDVTPAPDYKVKGLVNANFIALPLENIDFVRHLRGDIALNKKVTKSPNGRPDKAEYYNGNDLIAEIDFVFETNADNLLTRRSEHLYYYKTDDTKGPIILIKDKIYDMTDLVDGEAVVNEREQARAAIVSSMKAFLGGVLQVGLSLPLADVVQIILPFWDQYETERRDFIEMGDTKWRTEMAAIDLATTPYTFLSTVIDGNGTTMRDYIVFRLSY